jgi:hypothetical protein
MDDGLRGVSTRNYMDLIPQMDETFEVSKSSVSRQAIEAAEAEMEALLSRCFDDLKLAHHLYGRRGLRRAYDDRRGGRG